MELDKLPCPPPDPIPCPCDREVFERVWRRVMPEDRPDCPIVLDGAAPASPLEAPGPCAAPAPAVPCPAASGEAAVFPSQAAVQVQPPAAPLPAVPDGCGCGPDDDVPCLGAASAVYGAQLQQYIDRELSDWRAYQALARRAQGSGGRTLSTIAADERRHAKRLSTAYFLISGVRYWPVDRKNAAAACAFPAALRERFAAEQRGGYSYQAAAAETTDPCLRELYLELADDEHAHARLIRGILEQL